jgi:hypothetical protein
MRWSGQPKAWNAGKTWPVRKRAAAAAENSKLT